MNNFISANNANNIIPQYLNSGLFAPRPSITTIANAMDVGNPSNFKRILDIFRGNHSRLTKHMTGYSYSDDEIRETIKQVFHESGYVCDPHGATGYRAAEKYLETHSDCTGIFLATAHPAKFKETVQPLIGHPCKMPERLAAFEKKKKQSVSIEKDYIEFKEYLLNLD